MEQIKKTIEKSGYKPLNITNTIADGWYTYIDALLVKPEIFAFALRNKENDYVFRCLGATNDKTFIVIYTDSYFIYNDEALNKNWLKSILFKKEICCICFEAAGNDNFHCITCGEKVCDDCLKKITVPRCPVCRTNI